MKNKKGKKLVVLGAMAALLTLIGVSGSQTYAKYVESAEVTSQHATVAKWGFVINGNTEATLFGSDYSKTDADGFAEVATSGSGLSASAKSGDKIVMPGSEGSFSFVVKGEAEVASMLTIDVADTVKTILLSEKADSAKYYEPIKWSYTLSTKDKTGVINEAANDLTLEGLVAAVEKSFEYSPSNPVELTLSIAWSWKFDQGTTSGDEYTPAMTNVNGLNTNEADTVLAIMSANGNGYKSSIQPGFELTTLQANYTAQTQLDFGLNVTVEQIQA